MLRQIDPEAIEHIAVGAAVLGTGGGGDPFLGKLMALQAVKEHGPIPLISVDELDDDAWIVPAAMMGAPTVMLEKFPSGKELGMVFDLLQQHAGRPIAATMPIEIGGFNSLIPVVAAAQLGLPIVDVDAMGRAFPEMQMVTFYLDGINPSPAVMADEKGNRVLMHTVDSVWGERFARSLTIQMGGAATLAAFSVTGRQLKESGILGTLTQAEAIGRLITESQGTDEDPVRTVLDHLGGFELFQGKVSDIKRRMDTGFVRGEALFEGIGEWAGRRMQLYFQNEHLLALEGGKPRATTPDLIAVLDRETGSPITTEGLRYGNRVSVTAIPCHPKWRTTAGIEAVGPRYFGYECDYVPVEERLRTEGAAR
ncbi:DUF917 domain-containing protein [Desmospora profundinema]|uniref:DUF917 family protein n=1 Tax=Desmospora profundinema TaxID=1571184 RepID=A0ABU1IPN8_9BACL|nr:DUF917 domain-containing protein [Desmospora profundinema]MDR6226703.1 DUF917 family protein [Desmospora profundinema]